MGTCISKCNPNKTSKKCHKNNQQNQEECNCQRSDKNNSSLVQDKLVISQLPISIKAPLSPSKSSSSHTNSNYPSSSSGSSSGSFFSSATSLASSTSSSSIVCSKLDQSFSNAYVRPCRKQNPQFTRPNYLPIKIDNSKRSSLPTNTCHNSGNKVNGPKQIILPQSQQRVVKPIAQKRPRCNSPSNLTRQKSFRRDSEPESESNLPVSISGRYSKPISPSPSRRFTRESEPESEPNRSVSISGRYSKPISPSPSRRFTRETSMSQGRCVTSSMRRENNCYVRPPSPRRTNGSSRRYGRSNNSSLKNEDGIKMVNSKIQELAIGGLSTQDMDMMPIEDVGNPHIALDCFIFL